MIWKEVVRVYTMIMAVRMVGERRARLIHSFTHSTNIEYLLYAHVLRIQQ
jgi:hypothetical protein